MLKPTKTFRLSKTVKRMTALMGGPKEGRDQFKRMMIDAQLCSEIVVKAPSKDSRRPQGTANYQTNDTGTASTSV